MGRVTHVAHVARVAHVAPAACARKAASGQGKRQKPVYRTVLALDALVSGKNNGLSDLRASRKAPFLVLLVLSS